MMKLLRIILFTALTTCAYAQTSGAAPNPADTESAPSARVAGSAPDNQVVVTGVVPNQAAKTNVLTRLRAIYGEDHVIDEVTVGDVVAPPNWTTYVKRMLVTDIKKVSRGKLVINGNSVDISGDVDNEAERQKIVSDMATQLNPSYSINNSLAIGSSEQGLLDKALANRTIEFQSGSATLTSGGMEILDEMTKPLRQVADQTVEIIGHTDNRGSRAGNLSLSARRAEAVKAYLTGKGVPAKSLVTLGAGEQRPIASNETPEGRARNRRIEFRIRGPSS